MKTQLWNIIGMLTLSGCLISCSTHKCISKPQQISSIREHTERSQKLYEQTLGESVRMPEQVKGYPVGRYTDPNNPNVLHEAHMLYRCEQPARWDHTLQKPTVVPLGPTYAVVDPETLNSPISETLEKAFIEQTELLKQLYEQNEALTQKFIDLETRLQALEPTESVCKSGLSI